MGLKPPQSTMHRICQQSCKRVIQKIGIGVVILLLFCSNLPTWIHATTTTLSLSISPGTLTISAPTSFTFTSVGVSFITGTVTQDFTGASNYFIVTDLKGVDTGYTTTLQMASDMVTGAYTIASGNIAFQADYPVAHLLSGTTNPRVITDSNATGGFQALNVSRTFIYRNTALNTWVISQYGQHITLRITVPAGQPAGAYSGSLVYTLIEL